jgi:hypothetical protein
MRSPRWAVLIPVSEIATGVLFVGSVSADSSMSVRQKHVFGTSDAASQTLAVSQAPYIKTKESVRR